MIAEPKVRKRARASPRGGVRRKPNPTARGAAWRLRTAGQEKGMRVKVFNRHGELTGPIETPRVVKTDAEWRGQLTGQQFQIARRQGTEPAFCGTLLDNKKQGVYSCVCCGLPLFASDAKFHSGTGWPSFFQPVAAENVMTRADRGYGIGPNRDPVRPLRCPSGARLRGWAGRDWPPVLRQLRIPCLHRGEGSAQPRRPCGRHGSTLGGASPIDSSSEHAHSVAKLCGENAILSSPTSSAAHCPVNGTTS